MTYILALDQGTTSSRAILFDRGGRTVAAAQREFTQLYPRPGWVEHDPHEIWSTQVGVAAEALARAGVGPREVAAVGVANQRETVVVWDRGSGRAVCHAVVWQDRRTAEFCDRLAAEGHANEILERTGLLPDAYFSGSKLAWILDNVEGARRRAEAGELAFGTVDSWLVYNLTGGRAHVTDPSNASRTMLFNIHTGAWDEELLRLFRVPACLLPEVRPTSEVYAEVSAGLGLDGVPVAAVAGDQQAALFGQMCVSPGMTKCTYGTGCFLLQHTGARPARSGNRLISTVAWRLGEVTEYAVEGSVFAGGAVVQWLRDGLGLIRTSAEVEALAATVPDNGGVYLVPAFAGLGAPHWDPYARGLVAGLTRGSTAAHVARAALESIAYQVADLLDAVRADTGTDLAELRADGGAAENGLLMQFQADLLGIPVVLPEVTETTALGAAYLAGLAVGFWRSPQEIASNWRERRRYEPRTHAGRALELRARWREALGRAKGWEAGGRA